MKDSASPLFSQYIIDGTAMDRTPFSALYDCLDGNGTVDIPEGPFPDIVDESMDKAPFSGTYNFKLADIYVQKILHSVYDRRQVNLQYPIAWTKAAINSILLDRIFRDGHFTLSDFMLIARWDWNFAPAGNMSAFYDSTVSAGDYLFDLGIKLDRYFVEENRKNCLLEFEVCNKISSRRKCPDAMICDAGDWLFYIPFDSCRYALGGSALSQVEGNGGGAETECQDHDYFMDCYEVVRELVEDGVIKAGIPVGRGGLATAAEKFRNRRGFVMDISGMLAATQEKDPVRLLFAETPGVLVQISDNDYDYVDSQLLLQEVAYYPIARPDLSKKEISIRCESRDSIAGILNSLLSQASEGED